MTTQAEKHLAEFGGQWRTARVEHRCDSYFGQCYGEGKIRKGERYLDTHDMKEFTKGPVPYRACGACAQHQL